jgi:hypothetical protein
VNASIAFAGLTPGLTGLYQVNVTVPAGITPGNQVPVVLAVDGAPGSTGHDGRESKRAFCVRSPGLEFAHLVFRASQPPNADGKRVERCGAGFSPQPRLSAEFNSGARAWSSTLQLEGVAFASPFAYPQSMELLTSDEIVRLSPSERPRSDCTALGQPRTASASVESSATGWSLSAALLRSIKNRQQGVTWATIESRARAALPVVFAVIFTQAARRGTDRTHRMVRT